VNEGTVCNSSRDKGFKLQDCVDRVATAKNIVMGQLLHDSTFLQLVVTGIPNMSFHPTRNGRCCRLEKDLRTSTGRLEVTD
jgi:hypothetical protein